MAALPEEVRQGLTIFVTILGAIALLAAVLTGFWLLIFQLALKKLPPVQEALGLKKRDKPTLEEMRDEIESLKAQLRAAQAQAQQHGAGGVQPSLSAAHGGLRARR